MDIHGKEAGEWSEWERCPTNSYASEFSVKVSQPDEDRNHGVMAVRLKCYNINGFSNHSWYYISKMYFCSQLAPNKSR